MILRSGYLRILMFVLPIFGKAARNQTFCGHRPIPFDQIVTGINVHFDRKKHKLKAPSTMHLRIHFEYDDSYNRYNGAEQLKREVIIPAKKELESMLYAKNPSELPIRVPRGCTGGSYYVNKDGLMGCSVSCESETKCIDSVIPDKFLDKCVMINSRGETSYSGEDGAGAANTDIVLIVSVMGCQGATLASAGSCYQEKQLDRPILGVLRICNGMIKAGENIITNIATIQHEVIHALGFSSDKYAYFRNQDGTPIVRRKANNDPALGYDDNINSFIWSDNIAKKMTRKRSNIHNDYTITVYAFTLPTVLEIARKHFNCPKLDGVDLEPYPGLSHFSEYILYNEVMTPTANNALDKFSRFTLAFLKDTGWYKVDMTKAGDFQYGKNKGCLPILNGCHAHMQYRKKKGLSLLPFCDRIYSSGKIYNCRANRQYFYFCYLVRNSNLPQKYQYFTSLEFVQDGDAQYYGGLSEDTEFCPLIMVPENPNSICADTTNQQFKNTGNILDSYYGKDSYCFENGLEQESRSVSYGASCQKYEFNRDEKTLIVYYKTKTVKCPGNETYKIPANNGFTATFKCPDLDNFDDSGTSIKVLNVLICSVIATRICMDILN